VGRYDEARAFHLESLGLFRQEKMYGWVGWAYLSLSNTDVGQKRFASALENTVRALDIFEELKDKPLILMALNNLDSLYFTLNKFDEAGLQYHTRALTLRRQYGDEFAVSLSERNLGILF